jgi:adenylate cyclase
MRRKSRLAALGDAALRALRRSPPVWLSLAVLGAALVLLVVEAPLVVTLRHAVFDAYQRAHPRGYTPVAVRVVDVDDASLARFGQWPWPRTALADLVARLHRAGAAAIAFDMAFPEPDRSSPAQAFAPWRGEPLVEGLVGRLPDHDRVFADALRRAPTVVGFILGPEPRASEPPLAKAAFAVAGDDPRRFVPIARSAVVSLPELQRAAAGNGALNRAPSRDGVERRLPLLLELGETLYPTLTAEALRVAAGAESYLVKSSGASGESRFGGSTGVVLVQIGERRVVTDPQGTMWLHYGGPAPERTIPAWRVLAGELSEGDLPAGSVVFVGTSAPGLQDLRLNARGERVAGAEIHAEAAEQILQGTYLIRPDWARAAELLFTAAVSLALIGLVLRFGATWAFAVGTLAGGSCYLASWLAFTRGRLLLDPTVPSVTALAIYLVCSLSRQLRTERDKRWIRKAFQSYISPNLVRFLIDNPGELNLGGERRECSFVLTDIMGFTTLVERNAPDAVIALLNEYLDGMVAIALRHEGTLDRIVGDAVAVMFSAPVAQPDHATRAVACALAMDRFAQGFAGRKRAEGVALGRTRIGVNTGWVAVGNVGGQELVDYRALGDAVNTASRLEGANRALGTRVLVSGATAGACPGFLGRPAGTLILAGKSEGVDAFEPLTAAEAAAPAAAAYRRAFALLAGRDPAAEAAFAALAAERPGDPLAAFHLARLRAGESGTMIALEK